MVSPAGKGDVMHGHGAGSAAIICCGYQPVYVSCFSENQKIKDVLYEVFKEKFMRSLYFSARTAGIAASVFAVTAVMMGGSVVNVGAAPSRKKKYD